MKNWIIGALVAVIAIGGALSVQGSQSRSGNDIDEADERGIQDLMTQCSRVSGKRMGNRCC